MCACTYTLYAAVCIGLETKAIVECPVPDSIVRFMRECTLSYEKVKKSNILHILRPSSISSNARYGHKSLPLTRPLSGGDDVEEDGQDVCSFEIRDKLTGVSVAIPVDL
ncbi:hypothetical protein BS47DRAFT_1342673 [Hydnum rufescens UP504]|uniref:Uncharacterized protein n=1 Tax=Hydnum rufescens UP504 TaxID=1448309 RepID=A0A9P6AZV0_9AGAM|nr:hypothetical protein BS47DRAFT_1342673 [Hydnum rufescens UP504]